MKTKVEIKNVVHATNMSEETNAFTADIYIDGKKTGGAKNDGCGGCTGYWANGKVVDNQWEVDAAASARLKQAEEEAHNDESLESYLRCLDYIIDELVQDDLHWKEHQKAAHAAKVEYVDGGEVYQVKLRGKGKPTPELLAIVKKTQWWEDNYTMLNGLSKEEFTKVMRKCAEDRRKGSIPA
jgi:hypothetical protein